MGKPDEAPERRGELEELADDLDALSNVQRLRLLHFLTRPRYGGEIGDALGMSRQAALKHIGKLEERGFVRSLNGWRETGPVKEFQVVPQRLFALGVTISDLGKLEAEGGPEIQRTARTVSIPEGGPADAVGVEEEPLAPHLLIINGPDAGQRFMLEGDGPRWTIGREDDRDLHISHDPYVSGRHAEIQREADGMSLVDVYSANGTFLNFSRLPKGGRVELSVGDVIAVGHTFLVYQRT